MKKTISVLAMAMALLTLAACGADAVDTTPSTTVTEHVHVYVETVKQATCTEAGFKESLCACGEGTSEELPALGHSYTETVVAPTWDEGGYTEHKCSVCGDAYQDNAADPEKYSQLPPSQSGEVMHFFDDAAFIGDSVALKLQHYQAEYGSFGSATFFTTVSYSVNHAVNNTLFLIYQGREMTPEDALAACGAKKVFIQLGMNDIALVGIDKTIENWGVMLGRIREKNPDIEVYIQSGTPIYIGGEKGGLNNPNMDRYNERLKVFAEENNCHYIDIATVMKNEQGGLKAEFSLDHYVHVNYTACDAWAMVLKEYVGE